MMNLIFVALLLLTVAFSAIKGLIRGLNKSVIRIVTLLLAIVLTFVLAGPLTTYVVDTIQIEGMTLGQWLLNSLRGEEMIDMMLNASPVLEGAIMVLPALVIALVVFPVVFLALQFLTWIIFLCIQKPLRKLIFKDNGGHMGAGKRLGGLGVGIVSGVLVFSMLMVPVLGLFSILPASSAVEGTLDAMVEQNMLTQADADLLKQVYGITDDSLVKIYGQVGLTSLSKDYINSVTKIEVDGKTVYLADEMGNLMNIVKTAVDGGMINALMAAEDQNALFSLLADKDFMDTLMKDMVKSEILASIVPEVMAYAMESVASSMNVPANKEAVYNNMMDDVAAAVNSAEIDYAAIQAYEQANGVTHSLARSARTTSTATVMTEEEYQAEIEKLMDLVDSIAKILNKAVSGNNEAFMNSVAAQIVEDVKAQGAAADYSASNVQASISNIDASSVDTGDGSAAALLEQLTDAEKFKTDVATVETIVEAVRETVVNALADAEKSEQTASTLASVVSDLAGAVSAATNENGELDMAKLDYEKVASAVTSLQNSELKDVGTAVLDVVISGDLGDNAMIGDVMSAVKEGYASGENISGAIGSAGALINLGTSMGGDTKDEAAMVDSLTSLINNLDDYTISLLPSIITTDTIVSMGVPKQHADAAYDVIETLLKELMKLKGAADYDNEVNSILSLYNIATGGVEKFTKDDVVELADYAVKSDAIFNTLKSVSTSNPFGIQIDGEDVRADFVAAIEDSFAQTGKSQRERDVYNAIATLLGLDEEVNLA